MNRAAFLLLTLFASLPLHASANSTVELKDFGTIGTTNDGPVLKAAIESVAATGKTLLIPPANINITATTTITIPAGASVTIQGQGVSSSIVCDGASATLGTQSKLTTTLSASPSLSDRTVSLASVTGPQIGDIIYIHDSNVFPHATRTGSAYLLQ